MSRLLLVRHPSVCNSLQGICYGQSDAPLSKKGLQQIPDIIEKVLAKGTVSHIYQSSLSRCARLAEALSSVTGITPIVDTRLQERGFGDWELRSWNDIYKQTGNAMDGMITAPATWCPPGGETTYQLRDRVLKWYSELPEADLIVAITHGGPIAALRGTLMHRPVEQWTEFIPEYGELVLIAREE